jgi:hypothetical protein
MSLRTPVFKIYLAFPPQSYCSATVSLRSVYDNKQFVWHSLSRSRSGWAHHSLHLRAATPLSSSPNTDGESIKDSANVAPHNAR